MNKIIKLIVVFGIILLIISGCGKSTATKEEKSISDDFFEKGELYKISDSKENTSYFEVTSKEKGMLTVYDLENNRKEYQVPYETEKKEDGYLLYKFDGPVINDDKLFYNGAYNGTKDYYLLKIDGDFYFVLDRFVEKESGSLNSDKTKAALKKNTLRRIEKVK